MPKITLIAAVSNNMVLGTDRNEMPWEALVEDLKFFRDITFGNVIVMGAKTFESIGSLPLRERVNLVLTRNKKPTYTSAYSYLKYYNSVDKLLDDYKKQEELFVIGGGEVFSLFLPIADSLLLTEVDIDIPETKGIIKFPPLDKTKWVKEVYGSITQKDLTYTFAEYHK